MFMAAKKREYMTSLSGNRMVVKTNERITFRGLIDTLEAEVLEAQVLASERNEKQFCAYLGEILDYLRALMAAEVKQTPLPPPFLFGMDAEEIHHLSHKIFTNHPNGKAVLPIYTQGPLAARLNTLRAKVREVELFAVRIYCPDETGKQAGQKTEIEPREDIILALNRLSSAFWWLFCEYVSQDK